MLIFGWDKELESGIDIIDQQHKKMIQTANIFFIRYALKKEKEIEGAKKELEFLHDYTLYHFQAEEAFQVECGYSGYLEHQAVHKMIAQKLKFLSVELEASNFSKEKMEEFRNFVKTWIVDHVLLEDKKFVQCYKEYLDKKKAVLVESN